MRRFKDGGAEDYVEAMYLMIGVGAVVFYAVSLFAPIRANF
jgi:hypothetical protein